MSGKAMGTSPPIGAAGNSQERRIGLRVEAKLEPVEPGRDEDECEDDSNDVQNDHPAPEAVEEIAGQGRKKLFHA
jgi:hypothetical protein